MVKLKPKITCPLKYHGIKLDPTQYYFGIELEYRHPISTRNFLELYKQIRKIEESGKGVLCQDDSVHGELKTIPLVGDDMKDFIRSHKSFFQTIRVGQNVGFHIHVSKSAFRSTSSEVTFVVALTDAILDDNNKWLFGERCDEHAPAYKKNVEWFNYDPYPLRREAVALSAKDTIEVRSFRATNDYELVCKRIDFLEHAIRYANKTSVSYDYDDFVSECITTLGES